MGNNRVKGHKKQKSIKAKVTYKWGSKRRLSRYGKEIKKGEKGTLANYISRTQAIKKLQMTLKDFRRLCILKGIYPRDPKRKASTGKDKNYYHLKDISFLAHEPLLDSFREFKAFMKKLRKSAGRKETSEARRRWAARPTYTLDHLVKERYPRFVDALRDLDDALSLVHLFAALPQMRQQTSHRVDACRRIVREWQLYVARSGCLSKVFVSIKGVYCQAVVQGLPVTWVQPHQYTQHYPHDVDFRIMLTFLEFYEVLLKFVLFKLYASEGLRYPPLLDEGLDAADAGMLALRAQGVDEAAALVLPATAMEAAPPSKKGKAAAAEKGSDGSSAKQLRESERRLKSLEGRLQQISTRDAAAAAAEEKATAAGESTHDATAGDGEDEEDDAAEMGEALTAPLAAALRAAGGEDADVPGGGSGGGSGGGGQVAATPAAASSAADDEEAQRRRRLFRGLRFFLGREVPRSYVAFMIASQGGVAGWDGEGSPFGADDAGITHQIVDRPVLPGTALPRREYVQPQWVFDCINARMLLPVERYAIGASLPPHLSPFVDDSEEGYVPAYREELQRLAAASARSGGSRAAAAAAVAVAAGEDPTAAAAAAAEEEEEVDEDDEEAYARELRQEAAGLSFSEAAAAKELEKDDAAEEDEGDKSDESDESVDGDDEEGASEDGEEGEGDAGAEIEIVPGEADEEAEDAAAPTAADGSTEAGLGKRVRFQNSSRTEAEENHELSRIMMGKKAKRLYGRMQHGIGKKKEQAERLKAKRLAIENTYAKAAPEKKKRRKSK